MLLMRAIGRLPGTMLALGTMLAAGPAPAGNAFWIAKPQSVAAQVTAYGQVQPKAVVRLRAGEAGVLQGFAVQPGDRVIAGAVVGRLSGPPIEATLAARNADVSAAESALAAAQQSLAIEQQNRAARLSTRDAVVRAEAAVGQAQARLASARAQASAAKEMAVLRAPRTGRVLTVAAADGERITEGEVLLTVQPAHDLWLHAVAYGTEADTIRLGMSGEFTPADGSAPVAVAVRATAAASRPDGGRSVDLAAIGTAPRWRNGEVGMVTIAAGTIEGVAVPTRALILDRAQWWVLVHTATGDTPQQVTPGPSRDALTLIEKGLAPGTAVVVDNAYLEFHRGVAERYQPPD